MSWPSPVYVVSMWSIFHFHPHFCYNQSYNLIKADTIVFGTFFSNIYKESE